MGHFLRWASFLGLTAARLEYLYYVTRQKELLNTCQDTTCTWCHDLLLYRSILFSSRSSHQKSKDIRAIDRGFTRTTVCISKPMGKNLTCGCHIKKEQRKNGFKIGKKKFRLCARDEQGTWACSEHRTMVETTSLGREAILQVEKIITVDYFCKLQKLGLARWIAFKKQQRGINHLIDVINKLRWYKDRRLECGLFYLAPHTKICDVVVHSRLYDMPLNEALTRARFFSSKRALIFWCEVSSKKTGARLELKKKKKIQTDIIGLKNQTSPSSPLLY